MTDRNHVVQALSELTEVGSAFDAGYRLGYLQALADLVSAARDVCGSRHHPEIANEIERYAVLMVPSDCTNGAGQ